MFDGGRFRPDDPAVDRVAFVALGEFLTLSGVAEYLKIPEKPVCKMVRFGSRRAFKAEKHWRVQWAELGAWIACQSTGNQDLAK